MDVLVSCLYSLEKANPTDVGYDLQATEDYEFLPGDYKLVSTGCCVKALHTQGVDIHVRGRSSMACKGFLTHFGTVDQTYNSEIKVLLYYFGKTPYKIAKGDKVAQLVFSTFTPTHLFHVAYIDPDRGGFGSSGI